MDLQEIWEQLVELAESVGLVVHQWKLEEDEFREQSGLCWVRGTPTLILDEELPLEARVEWLAHALRRYNWETRSMPPLLRRLLAGDAPENG